MRSSTVLLAALHVKIHGLQCDFPRSGEAVPANLPRARKDSCGEFLKHRLHLHGAVLVNPAAWFDVNRFTRREGNLKHVAEAMQPMVKL